MLTHNKVLSIVGILADDTDPLVSVMKVIFTDFLCSVILELDGIFMSKVDKAPLESYADIGGLEAQIQEIKEAGQTSN